jgi:hypothetical protein
MLQPIDHLINATRLNSLAHAHSCPDLRRLVCIDIGDALLNLSRGLRDRREFSDRIDPDILNPTNTRLINQALQALADTGSITNDLKSSLRHSYTALRDASTHFMYVPPQGEVEAFLTCAIRLFAALTIIPGSYFGKKPELLLMDEFVSRDLAFAVPQPLSWLTHETSNFVRFYTDNASFWIRVRNLHEYSRVHERIKGELGHLSSEEFKSPQDIGLRRFNNDSGQMHVVLTDPFSDGSFYEFAYDCEQMCSDTYRSWFEKMVNGFRLLDEPERRRHDDLVKTVASTEWAAQFIMHEEVPTLAEKAILDLHGITIGTEIVFPDIVIRAPGGDVISICEIVTDSEPTLSTIAGWRLQASLCDDFRLYVPVGHKYSRDELCEMSGTTKIRFFREMEDCVTFEKWSDADRLQWESDE